MYTVRVCCASRGVAKHHHEMLSTSLYFFAQQFFYSAGTPWVKNFPTPTFPRSQFFCAVFFYQQRPPLLLLCGFQGLFLPGIDSHGVVCELQL